MKLHSAVRRAASFRLVAIGLALAALIMPGRADEKTANDQTALTLRAEQQRVRARYGGYRQIPLDVKAEHFEWALWRYHMTPYDQMHVRAMLSDEPGRPPTYDPGVDTATWNGSLLAALSYKYAVTRDPRTLARIGRLLRGMHLFFEVTRKPGLAARIVSRTPIDRKGSLEYVAADGARYHYFADPAKGTYNQIAGGYARLLMHVYDDLPPELQRLARRDVEAMALHLVKHDYKLTERSGRRTTYGDMTPLLGNIGVPFNAQVAYAVIAVGHAFEPDNLGRHKRIRRARRRLRDKHHAYYEDPLLHLVRPQRVGASPLVKGMNDRQHVIGASMVSLELELDAARRSGKRPDKEFLYEMGQTMVWGMKAVAPYRNALCNFMWAGILAERPTFKAIVPSGRQRDAARAQVARGVAEGIEQLRRFRLDRFSRPGERIETSQPQWVDAYRPDSFYWKTPHTRIFRPGGPPRNTTFAAVDYLYAYWLMRYYQLESHPWARHYHADVLAPTPEAAPPGARASRPQTSASKVPAPREAKKPAPPPAGYPPARR